MIDWFELAIDPTIGRLGMVIRSTFNTWAGFTDLQGNMVPVGGTGGQPKRVCDRFLVNSSADHSCLGSLRGWATADVSGEDPFKTCHAGLSSVTLPIRFRGEVIGSVFASGFLPADRSDRLLGQLGTLVRELAFFNDDQLDAALATVPLVDRSGRGFLLALLRAVVEHAEERIATATTRFELVGDRYGDMIGSAPSMKRLFRTLGKVARGNSTVLIEGENGTGKELIARAIHQNSRRATQPFVAQNCAAIPSELIESELFGHKKGAFSGAHRDRIGLFEAANHGTFFLDEIGEMDVALQVKLLRVLQEGAFIPVGDSVVRRVDVRVVCATNRDLRELVKQGKFREDLYYRINVIVVEPPPLRERREDIVLLATFFLNKACHHHDRARKRLMPDAIEVLVNHSWPGNVRQLENEMERVVVMTGDERDVLAEHLSIAPQPSEKRLDLLATDLELPEAVELLERQMILRSLQETGWNKTQSAKNLGVSRRNLIRKVAQFGFEEGDR